MYEVYKKDSPVKLGKSKETNPVFAAVDSLKFLYAVGKSAELTEDKINLQETYEGDYEFVLNGETYVLKKVNEPTSQDYDTTRG